MEKKGNRVELFWNRQQRRLRALWRLAIQWIGYFSLAFVLTIVAGLLIGILGVALGITFPDPGSPDFNEELLRFLNEDPLASTLILIADSIAMLASIFVVAVFIDRRGIRGLGLHMDRKWWVDLGFGLFLGAFLMAGVFLIELALGWVTIEGTLRSARGVFAVTILLALFRFLLVGIEEEIFSRGFQLTNMAEGLNFSQFSPRLAILLAYLGSSIVFGTLHILNPNATLTSTLYLMIAGLFLGLGYVLTGELAIPIGLHITWNFFQGNVFGFPVSGTAANQTTFIAISQGGPDLWTGGDFGPEAGLIGLVAIAVGSVLTVLWVRWRRGDVAIQESLAQYEPPEPSGDDS